MGRVGSGLATLIACALLGGCVTTGSTDGRGVFGTTSLSGMTASEPGQSQAQAAIQSAVQQDPALVGSSVAGAVRDFYHQRDNTPAWTDAGGLTSLGRQVRAVLDTAWVDGLTGLAPLPATAGGAADPASRARLDVALTVALADYVRKATAPPGDPVATANPWGVAATLAKITQDDPNAARPGRLFRLVSTEDRQARLRRAVLDYDALARAGGWPAPPASGPKLEPGALHPDIALVRARLAATGDHTGATPIDPTLYDAALADSVRRFQARQGLSVDAKIGPRTRAALAMPVDQRLRQMALNLRRLRGLPPVPVGRSVEVNIAGAHLEGRDNGVTTFRTDVIVGRHDRPTPELTSAINMMVLNPTWTVPTTIAQKDILPKVREDPEYLIRSGFTVYSGWDRDAEVLDPTTIDWTADDVDIRALRLRQAPGGANALGRIKFLFPNGHDVYLHSTPSRGLFARSQRTFSSGCVRVRDPMDFAAFLMNEDGQTAESLTARVNRGGTQTVRPRSAVPLSIIYVTAWVDEADTVHFRPDVYGQDARDIGRIVRRAPGPIPADPATTPAPAPTASGPASETPVPVSAPGPARNTAPSPVKVTETAGGPV